jgi:hypothetical protein
VNIPSIGATDVEILIFKPVTPVILALFATMLLGLNMNLVKYYDKKGFPADVFAFACFGASNFVQALVSIVVFYRYGFDL